MEKKKTATKKVQGPTRNSKKSIIIGIAILFVVMLILLGLTYAYYRTRVIGNDKNTLSVVSKLLEIKYEDGNATMNMEGLIEPGFEYEKTFSVRNTGDESVTYGLYLEEVINTFVNQDTDPVSFELTCVSNDGNECSGIAATIYPEENTKLVTNTIGYDSTKEVVHTYTLKVNYPETNQDQSDNMGKTLAGKVQIYDEAIAVDIEGSINGANAGDYVEINSTPKKSQIRDGKYKLTAVELGEHTLYVKDKNGNVRGQITLTINKGTQGASSSTITIDDASQTATLNIKTISATLGIEITKVSEEKAPFVNPYTEGTLAYAILNDNEVTEPKTIPGQAPSAADEAVLAATEDDYTATTGNPSYYFRGAVTNNYVNYSGMCWRIVRIDGNGNIKLVLADDQNECNNNEFSSQSSIGGVIKKEGEYEDDFHIEGSGAHYRSLFGKQGYAENYIFSSLEKWANGGNNELKGVNLDTSKLVTDAIWCNDRSAKIEVSVVSVYEKHIGYYYGSYDRLTGETVAPSLKCDFTGDEYNGVTKSRQIINSYGILNADEIAFAGGVYNDMNKNYYLYHDATEATQWTLSPKSDYKAYDEDWADGTVLILGEDGAISYGLDCDGHAIRPAILLKTDVVLSTSTISTQVGTQTNPYVID